MKKTFTLKLNHMLKKSLICATMLGLVVIALASSGGGKKKASSPAGIIPIKANGTFSLKNKPNYAGSHVLSAINTKNTTLYRSVITYQRGNTTFIVPSKYRLSHHPAKLSFGTGYAYKSNLKMLDLKLNLSR